MTRIVVSALVTLTLAATPAAAATTSYDLLTQADSEIDGAAGDDYSGSSVAAGDINGDGRDDVVIGSTFDSADDDSDTAIAHVVFGKRALPALTDLAALGTAGFRIDSTGFTSIAHVGTLDDVNGDGRSEVLVSGSGSTTWVVFGKTDNTAVDLTTLSSAQGYAITGASVASGAGDVNADGRGDLVVRSGDGLVVVFGVASSSGLDATSLGTGGYEIETSGTLGSMIGDGLGDLNGDGKDDLVVGEPYHVSTTGGASAGRACLVYGKANTTAMDLDALGASGFCVDGANAYEHAGQAVAGAGDVNADGHPDAVVGAPKAGSGMAGGAYVLFGSTALAATSFGALGADGFVIGGGVGFEETGDSVAGGGDANGDGLADVVVGTPLESSVRERGGSADVIFGSTSTSTLDITNLGLRGYRLYGAARSDQLGGAAALGNVRGSSDADPILGARYADPNGRTTSGATYVIQSSALRGPLGLLLLARFQPGAFRPAGAKDRAVAAQAPAGATLRVRLSAPARLRFEVFALVPGVRGPETCLTRPAAAGQGQPCTAWHRVGVLRRSYPKGGDHQERFTGVVGGRTLKPGRYAMRVRATGARGRPGRPAYVRFRIVR